MAKNPRSKPKLMAQALVQATFLFMNAAPQLTGPVPEGTRNRENEPWYVVVPSLGVAVMARDQAGDPITGYWRDVDASAWALSLYQQAINDPQLLKALRENPEWPTEVDDRYKLMVRCLEVPRPAQS